MANKTVLITGINGYIASHIAVQLFRKGYNVRGTARSLAAKQTVLEEAFKGYEAQYEHYLVPDITVTDAFDEAVQGVEAVIHVASPCTFDLPTLEDYMGPAVGSVQTILSACQRAGPQLKSLVFTSSVAAITDRWTHTIDKNYTDADWNVGAEKAARESFSAASAYPASKAAAERALWDLRAKEQPSFSISSVCPAIVMGPPVVWPKTPDELNETLAPIWKLLSGAATRMLPPLGKAGSIDVRDVAALHIWCMENSEQSDGERYLGCMGKLPPQAMADIMIQRYPQYDIVQGNPGQGYLPDSFGFPPTEGSVNGDKAIAALGGKDKVVSLDQMVLDTAEAFLQRWPGSARLKQSMGEVIQTAMEIIVDEPVAQTALSANLAIPVPSA